MEVNFETQWGHFSYEECSKYLDIKLMNSEVEKIKLIKFKDPKK